MNRLTNKLPFTDSKTSIKTIFSYIFDYAILIVLAIAYAALDKLISPFAQRFSLNDISIQYPYSFKERIPIHDALIISGAFPIVVIIIYTLLIDGLFSHSKRPGVKKYTFMQRLWELNCGILGLFLAQGSAFVITGTLKNLIGRPRPDCISRCRPQAGAIDSPVFGLSTKAICTQTDAAIMQDAFRSFPSGHSSSSFAGLGYLSLYLAGKLHVLDQRGEVWRTFLVTVPIVAASCVAASRIMDYRHHAFDVLFGSALGLLCAWASYRQYFPPLDQTWMKGRAYPMREWGVPIKQPGNMYGGGYNTARVDRTTEVLGDHEAAEIRYNPQPQEDQGYGLEPIRIPMRRDVSPGFENVPTSTPPGEDTDYEMIRTKAHGLPRQNTGGSNNVFREQMTRIEAQRRPGGRPSDDEEDLGTGNRSLLVGPGKV